MKNFNLLIIIGFIALSACNSDSLYKDSNYSIMERTEDLLQRMTLEEKVAQLNLIAAKSETNDAEYIDGEIRKGKVGCVLKSNGVETNYHLQRIAVEESRLGIPIMFQEDVIHGYKTIFPSPMAEACSWNLSSIRTAASIAAKEAAASGIHLTYAPMVDISRDPRWGRIVEGAGEDPYLSSRIAYERVKGFQGNDLSDSSTIAACAKHFIGYGDALAGRDYNIGDFSEREMREIYLDPFKAAIDADVKSIMCAYSAIDGIPATANEEILVDLLRNELEFGGLLITDWRTLENLIKIGVAADKTEAVLQAINAQVDVDMVSEFYSDKLVELVQTGKIDESAVDRAAARVLALKFELGLFDDPYKYLDKKREETVQSSFEHLQFARKSAAESMVLLKNENNILPIQETIKHIAVIGPLADRKKDLMSWWGAEYSQCNVDDVTSIVESIQAVVNTGTKISYEQGVILDGFEKKGLELIDEAVAIANQADVVVLVLGEEYWMSGEGGSVSELSLPGAQNELLEAIHKTGKPIITVLVNGRPFDFRKVKEYSNAILEAWQPGTMGGFAVADILFGKENPSGKLVMTMPLNTGQIPIFYNYRRTSHDFDIREEQSRFANNYLDISTEPLYPFGYGLSYSEFEYSNFSVAVKNDSIHASVDVKNISSVAGKEVVQLYVQDIVASVAQPHIRLKGFEKITLKAGEQKTVEFQLHTSDLTLINKEMKEVFEKGVFEIFVGPNSVDLVGIQVEIN